MAGIRSSNTKPERLVRSALHRQGYRFKLESKIGKIKPDIVLRSRKIAVFVHGCYWHQHKGCKLAYSDRVYSDSWKMKFLLNQARDERIKKQLLESNWRVVIIWECVTRNRTMLVNLIQDLCVWIEDCEGQYFESEFRSV